MYRTPTTSSGRSRSIRIAAGLVLAVAVAGCSGGSDPVSDDPSGVEPIESTVGADSSADPETETEVEVGTDSNDSGESADAATPTTDDTGAGTGADETTVQPSERFLANVTGSGGRPVTWPEIDGQRGDDQGQVTGTAAPSGWYEVSAPGHATTYARPVVSVAGYDLLDVELTPLGRPVVIGGESQRIGLGDGAAVTVPAGALPGGTWLTVTELPARHLSAPWAPVDGGHRTRVFSFESSAPDGSAVQPVSPLTLHLDDADQLGGVTALATFDRDAGRWVESGACTESAGVLDCDVVHFSLSTPVGGQPYPSDPPDDGADTDEQQSQEQAEQDQAEQDRRRDEQEQQQIEDFPERVRESLDAATNAARSNPTRATKDRLATMIVVASDYDIDTGPAIEQLGAAYQQVAAEIVDTASRAERPRCDQMPALAGVIAEGEIIATIGASVSGQQAAIDLLAEIELECRYYWTGTVEYRFPAPPRWEIYSLITPGPGALYEDRGIDEWRESAYVTINIDPESGQLEGNVNVATAFVPLRFRLDLNSDADVCPIESWEDFIVEGIGSDQPGVSSGETQDLITRAASGTALIPLEFDGFYEPPQFSLSPPRLAGESGIRIQTQVDVHVYIVPCESLSDSVVGEDVVEPYTTQLIDGFEFLSPVVPKVTLEEMLNAPSRTEPDGRIVIEGRRDLEVTMDLIVPFQQGTVTWKFSTQSVYEGFEGAG
jgi:hypothetical protein